MYELLEILVLSWAREKDLLHRENAERQFMEEVFEFHAEWQMVEAQELLDTQNLRMEMGDIMVTLIILANQLDLDLLDCLEMAYRKIKDRKGKTVAGTFVKEEDL